MQAFVDEFRRLVANPSTDRNNAAIPAAVGSPGTGKSRLADEIGNRLREELNDMHVIDVRVTFNSPTYFDVSRELHLPGIGVLCARMLYMTVARFPRRDTRKTETWDDFRDSLLSTEFGHKIGLRNVCRVLRAAAGIEEDNNCCVYLAIDECTRLEPVGFVTPGVQRVCRTAQNLLEVVMRHVGQMMVQPDDTMWIAPLFLATDVAGVKHAIQESHHPPFDLAMTLLAQSDVVKAINPVIPGWKASAKFMRTLADMGGNMRAVEEMVVAVEAQWHRRGRQAIDKLSFHAVFNEVLRKLERYVLPSSLACFTTIQHSILGVPVNRMTVVDSPTTFGDLESSGLLTLTPSDMAFVVSQPFVQLYRMVNALKKEKQYSEIVEGIPCDWKDIYKWGDWEEFNVRYEACRLTLFRSLSPYVQLKDLYRGARVSKAITNRYIYLQEKVFRTFETSVKFDGQNLNQKLPGTGDYSETDVTAVWRKGGYVILNGTAAPYADAFCYCPTPPKGETLWAPLRAYNGLRLFQYKFRETNSPINVVEEAVKAGYSDATLFSLHTNFTLEDNALDGLDDTALWAVVSHEEFEAYYGPYAGRATYAFGMNGQSSPNFRSS